jgi:hypothetical protein
MAILYTIGLVKQAIPCKINPFYQYVTQHI